jgi:hypothetical protein
MVDENRWSPRTAVRAFVLCAIGLAALSAAAPRASAQVPSPAKDPTGAWFQVTPYLWMASIKGENTIGIPGGDITVPIDVNFGDIWSNLKFAFSFHFEGGANHGLGGFDFAYIRLGVDDIEFIEAPGPIQPRGEYRFTIVQTEFFGAYRGNPTGKTKFDLLGGTRLNNQNQDFSITGVGDDLELVDISKTWVDFFGGFRIVSNLGRKVFLGIRGDAGTGGSKFTGNGIFTFGFQISSLVSLDLAFRYLYINYETGVPNTPSFYAYKADQYGIILGAGFHF